MLKKLPFAGSKTLITLGFIIFSFTSFAQEQCLSDILHQRLMQNDATYRSRMITEESIVQQKIAEKGSGSRSVTIYRIPVVVHVIHLGEAVGTGTNISDQQIYSAIKSINDAYRKSAGSIYDGNGVDAQIEFCLAQKDAVGNPSTGIIRINGSGTSDYATNGITTSGTNNETIIKALSKWDNTKYYNVWIVSEIDGNNAGGGTQGYAYFPGAGPTYDGAVMMYNAFGYDPTATLGYNLKSYTNLNMTFIHEMGHALNLYHTFEGDGTGSTCPANTACSTDGDLICDTPPHKRSASTCVADATANPCLGGGTAGDFQHNYMDYSAEACKNMFSAGQATRMQATLGTGGSRASLTSTANLTACGCDIPVVRFAVSSTTPCPGFPVQFTDESLNFPTSWSWTFNSGSPGTSTTQNPSITYNSSGSFDVTLQATVAGGSTKTLTKTAYINPPTPASLPFTENFEGTFPPTGWSVYSPDGAGVAWGTAGIHQWVKQAAPFNTGSTAGCAAMNCFNYNIAGISPDDLISKSISLSGMASATMTFKVAHKYFNNPANYDSLKVFVSTDCGSTYGAAVYNKSGLALANNNLFNTSYTPTATADWRTETVNLDAYAGQTIILKFVSYSKLGNNIYVDDINITGSTSGAAASVAISSSDADNTICAGSSVTFTATPTNGGTTPSYQWKVGATDVGTNSSTYTTTGLTTGQVVTCVMTSNMPGVTASPATSNAITTTVNASPAAPTAGSNSPVCAGSTINLTSNTVTGATYSWTGPSAFTSALEDPTRASSTTVMAGTYSVTVRVGGCTSAVATTAVVVNAKPATPTAGGNTPACVGGTLNLTSNTVVGGTYSWTGPNTFTSSLEDPSLSSLTTGMSGTYSVTVTVNGCTSAIGTKAIVVNTIPATPTAGNTTPVVCAGSTINLTASTVTGATYSWTGPSSYVSTSQNPARTSSTTAMSGTYSVTAKIGGCSSAAATTAVVVNAKPATPTVGGNTPACVGGTLNLTSNTVVGGTYSWTGPNTFTSSIEDPSLSSLTTAMSGTYSVTITVNGCTSTAGTKAIVVNTIPATPTAGSTTPVVCAGSTINLTSSTVTGATYSWTGPSSYTSISQNPARTSSTTAMSGTYSVTAKVGGCSSAAATTAVIVNAKPATPIAGGNTPVCVGSTLNLTSNTVVGGTYSWTGPNTFTSSLEDPSLSSLTTAMSGTYSVTVAVNGCTSAAGTKAIVVNTIPATPIAGSNTPVCVGASINLTASNVAGATYAWTGPSSFTSTAINPSRANATTLMAGTYSVTVKVGGCTSVAGTTAVVVGCSSAVNTGIVENPGAVIVDVYPNPNDGSFIIQLNVLEKTNYHLQIKNIVGQVVYQEKIDGGATTYSRFINISQYGAGIYFISLADEKDLEVIKKIIVQ
jgi:PKD repeat protein